MTWWVSCLWGLVGAGAVEALALYRAIHRVRTYPWRLPGEVPLGPYLASVLIRVSLGAGAAAAFAVSDQVSGPLGAVAVGITAPKIIEHLMRYGSPAGAAEPDTVAAPREPPPPPVPPHVGPPQEALAPPHSVVRQEGDGDGRRFTPPE